MRALVLAVALLAPGAALAQVVSPITSTQPPVPPGAGVMNDAGLGGSVIAPTYSNGGGSSYIVPRAPDFGVGTCEPNVWIDGGGWCLETQYGFGLGVPGVIEIVDVSNIDFSNVQTKLWYWTGTLPDAGAVPEAIYSAVPVQALAGLISYGTLATWGNDVFAHYNDGGVPDMIWTMEGANSVRNLEVFDPTGVAPIFFADFSPTGISGSNINLYQGALSCTGVNAPDGIGTFAYVTANVAEFPTAVSTFANTANTQWATVDAGQPVAVQADQRFYAVFTGATTTTTVGASLVQAVFSAPSAGVPARFAFHVNTAGLGAGNVTISLFDSTTSASKGSATFGCTATGDQNLAVTSPTAWAVNDAVEIRIDDSACTAANGPIGIPSASVKWQ